MKATIATLMSASLLAGWLAVMGSIGPAISAQPVSPDAPAQAHTVEMLVLMHQNGKVERYDPASGKHLGTLISGLPPANDLLADAEGRLLISTGLPGGMGTVLQFDPTPTGPNQNGKIETLIDIPEGYGGRVHRATGMAWHGKDLLVASQGDGKVKRYRYPEIDWVADIAQSTPGAMTQIAVHQDRLYVSEYGGQRIARTKHPINAEATPADISLEPWATSPGQSPWGLVFDPAGQTYFSTSTNRIHRLDGKSQVEWAGSGGGLAIPIGLRIGPDGSLYAANLQGKVTQWQTEKPTKGTPLRTIGGPEMQSPTSLVLARLGGPKGVGARKEFVYQAPGSDLKETPEKLAFFESKVRPLVLAKCVECHGEKKQKGGLRLDSKTAWLRGGELGPALVPGKPEESLLIKAVRYQEKELAMPPKQQLSADEMKILVDWVKDGAIDPRQEPFAGKEKKQQDQWEKEFQKRLGWWSLQPVQKVAPPAPMSGIATKANVGASSPWDTEPIDRFIRRDLDRAGLAPALMAEPEILLRRLSFVLTGLPPTPQLRERFLKASAMNSQRAYEALVDELLASPHFGERFARHWMDVVRYTDTYGYEWDNPAKGSFEYRDYLIRAFNGDLPFDRFLTEQLAGDLLPTPRINKELGINESLIGPMFYHMGEHRHGSSLVFNGVHQEMVNNKIEAFSKAFLATTVACSRCHDHKLEAVSQHDYYALGAVFMTPRWTSRVVDAPGKNDEAIAKLTSLRSAIRTELAKSWRQALQNPATWNATLAKAFAATKPATAPKIEEVSYPIGRLLVDDKETEARWKESAAQWNQARADRQKANAAYSVLADFAKPGIPTGWVMEGDGMTHGYTDDATPLIALEGDAVIAGLLPRGYHTHALSSRLPGALRMPAQHLVPGNFVSLKLAGGQFGGYLQIHENAFQGEEVTFLNDAKPQWRSFGDIGRVHGITRITYDFATSALNPNFPPRTGLAAGLPNNDFGYDKRSWISFTGIVTHDAGGTPQDTLDAFATLYEGPVPKTRQEVQERLSGWMTQVVERWCENKTQQGELAVLEWLLANKLLFNQKNDNLAKDATGKRPLADLLMDYRKTEQGIAFARTINSMDERDTPKAKLAFNARGNVDAIGEGIAPDFLQMFAGKNEVAQSSGSGRLELAQSLLRADHPLTARVYANRVWQWIMGTGIVATPDDFGHLGEKPTHPELLDYLATELVREGWSTKKLIRRLVLSQTFRESGQVNASAALKDPQNRLRHHYPTRRLDAEAIRDSLLSISGRLDESLYGRPIFPPRPAEDGSKRLYSGPVDGNGRRSIYQQMSIMEPPKFLVGFNLPDLRLPTGRRDTTNVPAQALILLNDPLVVLMAHHWAKETMKTPAATPAARVSDMFVKAFGRNPAPAELERWSEALADFATPTQPGNTTKEATLLKDEEAWAQLAHAFFNSKEFLYYR